MKELCNELNEKTVLECTAKKNETIFSIPVGLHPKDMEKIGDLILKELKENCSDTKRNIEEVNEMIRRKNAEEFLQSAPLKELGE